MAVKPIQLRGQLKAENFGLSWKGVRIEIFDQGRKIMNSLAETETDKNGAFLFKLNPLRLKREFEGREPEVFFNIKKKGRIVFSTRDELVVPLVKEVLEVAIELPKDVARRLFPESAKLPEIDVIELLRLAGVSPNSLNAVFDKMKSSGLSQLEAILSRPVSVTPATTGMKQDVVKRFLALAKFAVTSGSLSLAQKLVDRNFNSFSELGAVSGESIRIKLGHLNKEEALAIEGLYRKARTVYGHVANYTAKQKRMQGKDGHWYLEGVKETKTTECKECVGCENIFSPKAYLFDLLDLVYRHWEITTETLEKIFLQQIINLDCDELQAGILQIEMAIEVLENYLGAGKIPISSTKFSQDFTALWADLLSIAGKENKLKQLSSSANNATPIQKLAQFIFLTNPELKTIRAIKELLSKKTGLSELAEISTSFASESDQFEQMLAAAYVNVLVLYRQALIKKTSETAEALQDKLFIDLKSGGCKSSNRLTQFILALQSFILAIRTGEIVNVKRTDIPVGEVDFKKLAATPVEELTWKWLKDYQDWAAAMYAFLYPENVMMPVLVNDGIKVIFKNIRDELFQLFRVEQADVKEAYLRLVSSAAGVNLVSLLDLDPDTAFFFYPEAGFLVDPKFFPPSKTYLESDENARAFIRKMNEPIPLSLWVEVVELYLTFLGLYTEVEEKLFLERLLYFPLFAGFILNRSGEYPAAHDWYRQLYDPEKSGIQRFIFDFHATFTEEFGRTANWYNGVLDPHDIALHREGVFLRHTIFTMVRNILDWADHEFALATPESLDRARDLYELAREILAAPDLADHCGQAIYELTLDIVTAIGIKREINPGAIVRVIEELYEIRDPEILEDALKGIRDLPDPGNIDPVREIVDKAVKRDLAKAEPEIFGKELTAKRENFAVYENLVLTETKTPSGRSPHPIYFSAPAVGLFDGFGPQKDFITFVEQPFYLSVDFCIPANPLLKAFSFYIDISLLKFQLCLDIAGEPLPAGTLSSDSANEFLKNISGQLESAVAASAVNYSFTEQPRYRYTYLVERAKQYVEVAQRLGATLLQAYERSDSESFQRLQTRHAIELANATISLRNLGVQDARKGLDLALLQQDRATFQLDFWQNRLDEGMLSNTEQFGLNLMLASAWLNVAAGVVQGLGAIVAFFTAGTAGTAGGAAVGTVEPGGGNVAGGVVGGAAGFSLGAALAAAIPGTGAALGSFAGALSTFGSHALTLAGFERRYEDWQFQRDLSDFDVKISEAQVASAGNRVSIANQELTIAQLQRTQAVEVLEFLENKFSNLQLYEWMISVLGQGYRTIMQIAVSVAKMAQRALEFERQEKVEIIIGDYWSLSGAGAPASSLSDKQKESGLLGAERLLTDLTRLDAYKLRTEKRRLQLSKTISLAQMLPGELAHLRATGRVAFNTLMHWFDRDFAGHYLRLIKSVRISMLALTPPVDGIHATLSNSGESSVVVRENLEFVKKRAFRDFGEIIALDSPYNETGLFVFDYNDPMFLPFEGLGVETQWLLTLPKASNRFNFDTLVDVLFTIEYTALYSEEYAQIVRAKLGTTDVNDIPFNLKQQFPDEWYHFKNTYVETAAERQISVDVPPQFVPSHYEPGSPVSTLHLTVMLQGDFKNLTANQKNQLLTALTVSHEYPEGAQLKTVTISSSASTPTGNEPFRFKQIEPANAAYAIFSTRSESNTAVKLPADIHPAGKLTLSIKNGTLADSAVYADLIDDIFVVLTTSGQVSWQ